MEVDEPVPSSSPPPPVSEAAAPTETPSPATALTVHRSVSVIDRQALEAVQRSLTTAEDPLGAGSATSASARGPAVAAT
ncbi:MAG TPA: hypothetical protein VIV06_09915, partial [Candidatus Limnocylindrales bacterium]